SHVVLEQEHRFDQHRLAHEQRCLKLLDTFDYPMMIALSAIKEGNDRPGVNDGEHRVPVRLGAEEWTQDRKVQHRSCRAPSSSVVTGGGSAFLAAAQPAPAASPPLPDP